MDGGIKTDTHPQIRQNFRLNYECKGGKSIFPLFLSLLRLIKLKVVETYVKLFKKYNT